MAIHSYKKTSKNNKQPLRNNASQPINNPTSIFQFVDNRPETIIQQRLQEGINNSPQAILQRNFQEIADNHSKSAFQFVDNRPEAILQRKLQVNMNSNPQIKNTDSLNKSHPNSEVIQRTVQIGDDTYESRKRGYTMTNLINLIAENKGTTLLKKSWREIVKEYVRADSVTPKPFDDIEELIEHLKRPGKRKRTAAVKNREQDDRIQGMNSGYGDEEYRRGRILAYEGQKAFNNFTSQVQNMDEYANTKMELENVEPGLRSETTDFDTSTNPFLNFLALANADLNRLDFMATDDVEIDTHGYSSRSDRSVNPNTLNSNFGFGTIKVGPDISTYRKEMESDDPPNPNQLEHLNSLEMHRLPQLAPHTAMKRELYRQSAFTKEQAMGFDHDHTSVEFVGAVSGSSMTNQQRANMKQQQSASNYAILQTANEICPDTGLGQALGNGKHIPTPSEEMNALTELITIIDNAESAQNQKDEAKRNLRKVLMQVLRGVTQIQNVESDDETNYPTSPFYQTQYD